MLILTKTTLVLLISLLISILLGTILIPLIKKFKLNQQLNKYLEESHRSKSNTPTMGGIIFILSTIITLLILYIFNKIDLTYNFIIVIIVFLSYGFIGFTDDLLIIIKKNNKGLSASSKMLMQIIIAIIFFYLFMKAENEPLLWIHTIGFKLNIGWLYGVFILLVLTSSSNAVNLTDGLDGLATGLSIIAFLAFGLISLSTGWLDGYEEIALFCFSLSGSLLGFLIFNSHPASIFMGDTGSLALGATLGSVAILTRHEIFLLIIGFVFVLETVSVIIQVSYYKLTKRRVFLMTPLHHHFEKKGYSEQKIVKLFWIIGLISTLIAIIVI
ncbi:MAG: phospho-N-acetylmuramoyl-pentapeptide-transferase [Bacilli bacterium]|nr:phospho-N-acetylmuramoyl-pentapeptide-transferase [Bacilli bacterium]